MAHLIRYLLLFELRNYFMADIHAAQATRARQSRVSCEDFAAQKLKYTLLQYVIKPFQASLVPNICMTQVL